MTGFGEGREPLPEGQVVVEARAVNHRYLDVRVRAPSDLPELAAPVEERLRRGLVRGRIEAQVRVEASAEGPDLALNADRARTAFAALARLRDELAPGEPVPLALLAAVPELFAPRARPAAGPALREAAARAADGAVDALLAMRRREGAHLAADLGARLDAVAALVARLGDRAPHAAAVARDRLRERVARLLEGTDVAPDPARLAQEVALAAEKGDVTEELTRLASHVDQFRAALASGDDGAVGRRLDFLLQEMNREANTTGAKSPDAALSHLVVDLKSELERLREQVQNVL